MNKSESKYFNTANKIDEAFLELLNKKEFDYITVKEICEKAKVNRSTFYLHYETISDLLLETYEYISKKFLTYFENVKFDFKNLHSQPLETLNFIQPEYLTPYLTFIKENKRLYQTVLEHYNTLNMQNNYKLLTEKILFPILERYGVTNNDKSYMILFYLEGLNGVVKEWIRENCEKDISEIANIIMLCINRQK